MRLLVEYKRRIPLRLIRESGGRAKLCSHFGYKRMIEEDYQDEIENDRRYQQEFRFISILGASYGVRKQPRILLVTGRRGNYNQVEIRRTKKAAFRSARRWREACRPKRKMVVYKRDRRQWVVAIDLGRSGK